MKLIKQDYYFLGGISFFMALFFLALNLNEFFSIKILPFEDAAMIIRYAQNIANGYGIVWNVGGSPVDGCTDFLLTIVLAALIKLHLPGEFAIRLLGTVSHLITIFIIYIAAIRITGLNRWYAIIISMFFTIGLALLYIASYWGTPFFALFASISWYMLLKLSDGNKSYLSVILFSIACLLLGLTRPEGVFLSIFMVLALIYYTGLRNSLKVIYIFTTIYLVFGGIYFIWRWDYFGYPLPNPFYIKGGGILYLHSLTNSIKNAVFFCLPLIIIHIVALFNSSTRRYAIFSLIPFVGFTFIWILLSNEMNILGRFQYAVLPIMLISSPYLYKNTFDRIVKNMLNRYSKYKRWIIVVIILLSFVAVVSISFIYVKIYVSKLLNWDSRYDVGIMLNEYKDRNYTIALSEAGLIPLYSEWRSIDLWGYNDLWIAHNHIVSEEYLDKYKPEIIMYHSTYSQDIQTDVNADDYNDVKILPRRIKWQFMCSLLYKYVHKNNYVLAAAFGESVDAVHYYFVKADFKDSEDIINKLRNINYIWHSSGHAATNFAN